MSFPNSEVQAHPLITIIYELQCLLQIQPTSLRISMKFGTKFSSYELFLNSEAQANPLDTNQHTKITMIAADLQYLGNSNS